MPLDRSTLTGLVDRAALGSDVVAGITVAAMLVPQSMAYALLAGLPPEVGLYASTVPLVAYALIGTSRQLAVGPVAIVSLLTATALAQVADEGTAGYVAAAAVLALLVGAVHLLLGVLRLGFLVRLLSHPVLVGYTAAAALVIGTSQLRHVLGTAPDTGGNWFASVGAVLSTVPDLHPTTLVTGLAALVAMVVLRRVRAGAPVALVAVAATTVASVLLDLPELGVRTVGSVPAGLPPLALPAFDEVAGLVATLLPAAVTITLVGVLESIAVAKVYARRGRDELDPDRELLALGAANVAAGLVGGQPVTGGFSRTAVNASAGARTRLAGVVTALCIVLTLLVLTPLFAPLPQATLGAIVLLAVTSLVDVDAARRIWEVRRGDALTMAGAFVATLALGVDIGIAVAALGSAVLVFRRIMAPHTAVLGRLPDTEAYRNVDRYDDLELVDGVTTVRFDVSLNYLNVEFMKERVRAEVADDVHAIVLDLSGVNDVDSAAAETLVELLEELDDRDIALHLAATKGPVRDVLGRTTIPARIAGAHLTVHDAVLAATDAGPRAAAGTGPTTAAPSSPTTSH